MGLRAAPRLGAARLALLAFARPRAGFLTNADLRRLLLARRAALLAAVLRFVADVRLATFLVLVVFVFDFRTALDITFPRPVG